MTKNLTVDTDTDNGVITPRGEIDFSNSPDFRKQMHSFIKKTSGDIQLDLSEVDYLDSSGLAVVIEAHRLLAEKDRRITIPRATPQVTKVFKLTQVASMFDLPTD